MARISLSNGWYLIPGDGTGGDPDRRSSPTGFRYYHFAYVENGEVVGLWGDIREIDPVKAGMVRRATQSHRTYKSNCEARWGTLIVDLMTEQDRPDDWAGDFELEPT